jgi:RNA polymerase sigma factor (sigma-70 family)
MDTTYTQEPLKTEQNSDNPDYALIEAVQQRHILIESGCTDLKHPIIRKGERALAELLSRYENWIWKQVHNASGIDTHEAHSTVLEFFSKAIATFDLTSGYALTTYAVRCVRNALNSLHRKENSQSEKVTRYAANASLVHEDEFIDPYEQAQRDRTIGQLYEAIGCLNEGDREIVLLHDEQGKRFTEICELVGRSYDAVRQAYYRAKRFILGLLQPSFQSAEAPEIPLDTPEIAPIPEKGWMGRLLERFKSPVRFFIPSAISNSSPITETSNDASALSTAFEGRSSPQTQTQTGYPQIPERSGDDLLVLARRCPHCPLPSADRSILRVGDVCGWGCGMPAAQTELAVRAEEAPKPRDFWTRVRAVLGLADNPRTRSRDLLQHD